MTLLERKTRQYIIRPLASHTAECVTEALDGIKTTFGDLFPQVFKSITADNGSEFYELSQQLDQLDSKAYFCHPYSSWEKGANEKHNSLIRRFIPKGKSIANVPHHVVSRIEINAPEKYWDTKLRSKPF